MNLNALGQVPFGFFVNGKGFFRLWTMFYSFLLQLILSLPSLPRKKSLQLLATNSRGLLVFGNAWCREQFSSLLDI